MLLRTYIHFTFLVYYLCVELSVISAWFRKRDARRIYVRLLVLDQTTGDATV